MTAGVRAEWNAYAVYTLGFRLILLCASLVGQACGPLLVGFLNDQLRPVLGEETIRYSMLVAALCAVAGGAAFWLAVRHMESDISRAHPRSLSE